MNQEIKNIYLRREGGAFRATIESVDIDSLIPISISDRAKCYCYRQALYLYYFEDSSWYIQR